MYISIIIRRHTYYYYVLFSNVCKCGYSVLSYIYICALFSFISFVDLITEIAHILYMNKICVFFRRTFRELRHDVELKNIRSFTSLYMYVCTYVGICETHV